MTNRRWFDLHSWLGVMSGLLLFVICWSGTMATISGELDWLANPDLRVTEQDNRAEYHEIYDAVEEAFPGSTVSTVREPLYANFASEVYIDTPLDQRRRVYVDPYSAKVLGSTSYFTIQRFFRSFHMNLFGPFSFVQEDGLGYYIVGLVGVLMLASLVTSLFFYKRWWRRFFELKIGSGAKAFWSSAHKVCGLWSLWFLLVIGITGTWYLYEHSRLRLADGIAAHTDTFEGSVHRLPALISAEEALPLKTLVERVQSERPGLRIKSIRPNSEGYFYVEGQDGDILVRDRANKMYLDPATGGVVFSQEATDLSAYWYFSDMADPLHFGDFGGLWTKLIWVIFGLGLSGLALTGTWLHVKRLRRDRWGRAQWTGTLAAVGLTYAILGVSAWHGIHEIKDYGPIIDGAQQWPMAPFGVWAVVGAWVALTATILLIWTAMLVRALRPT
ncbi:peptidase [Erythrobacter sp. KY5]|uniref:PepSY-associated TM helix domain-containing protein n=1 Tax=Erythrobacter sp. KY5 TaxID=2011159 RepID=UPI000DBF1E71|nr:PepSY-associated TM helix domain-containing protein [Erythrobacter sp. KY5]AWW74450.1 peptidase [Erythrobacter sp. KY5]